MTKIFPHRDRRKETRKYSIKNLFPPSIILVSFTITLHRRWKLATILHDDVKRNRESMEDSWMTLVRGVIVSRLLSYSSRSSIETIPPHLTPPESGEARRGGEKGGRGRGGRKHSTFLQLTRLVWNWTPPWGANKCLVGACAAGAGAGRGRVLPGVKRLEGRKRCRWELLIVVD